MLRLPPRPTRTATLYPSPTLFRSRNIKVGTRGDFGVDDGILCGTRLASQLGVGVGGSVTLVSPSGNTTVMGTVPRMKTYRIAGLFEVGMYEYDNGFKIGRAHV